VRRTARFLSLYTILSLATAGSASAEWHLAPLVGLTFAGNSTIVDLFKGAGNVHWHFGGAATVIGAGPIGVEALFVLTPSFFEQDPEGLSLDPGLVQVTNSLPLNITAAGATGTLQDVRCASPKGITVRADPKAFSGPNASSTLEVKALVGLVHLLGIQTTTSTPSIDGPAVDLSFSYPNEFAPPGTSKHAGSQPVGLQSLTNVSGTAVDVNALGLLTVGLTSGNLVNSVLDALHTLIGNVDTAILTPLLTALGLDVGSADVTAPASDFNAASCGQPRLIG